MGKEKTTPPKKTLIQRTCVTAAEYLALDFGIRSLDPSRIETLDGSNPPDVSLNSFVE